MQNKAEICLVDDEVEIIRSFSKVLSLKYNVRTFLSGAEAMEAFDQGFQPQAIVTDLKMPQMDGLGFINKVHQTDLKSKIVLISGHADKQDTINAMNAGVYRFLEKPFPMSKLSETLDEAIGNFSSDTDQYKLRLDKYQELVGLLEKVNASYFGRLASAENIIFDFNPALYQVTAEAKNLLQYQKSERLLDVQIKKIKNYLKNK